MRTWLERFNALFGPGVLAGVTFGDWLALLRDNGFRVSPRYLPRAATITGSSLLNSVVRFVETRRHAAAVDATVVPPPLFVLGFFRSGTTLLHDLLAVDPRFAWPNLYQVIYPHTFLTTEAMGSRMLRLFSPKHRPQDNMKLDPAEPWEDEFALCVWGAVSSYLGWAFPDRVAHYDRFLTFADATPDALRTWRETMTAFVKKVTLKHGKPLVLKSPTHTARVRLLLEMFPGARFVHIHRNPYDVFRSYQHLCATVIPMIRLQRTHRFDWTERLFGQYREMHDALLTERSLIPPGCYHEMSFEELEKEPVGQMRNVYQALGLPDFGEVEPRLRAYVESIKQYRKNAYRELDGATRDRVSQEWARYFQEWGYPA
jgi:hypothetical protein